MDTVQAADEAMDKVAALAQELAQARAQLAKAEKLAERYRDALEEVEGELSEYSDVLDGNSGPVANMEMRLCVRINRALGKEEW